MIFAEVLAAVHGWFEAAETVRGRHIGMKVVGDTDTAFWAILESEGKIGELIVAEPDFAPYRFVSFRILDMEETPAFCYYDSEDSTLPEILSRLDAGLAMM